MKTIKSPALRAVAALNQSLRMAGLCSLAAPVKERFTPAPAHVQRVTRVGVWKGGC